tara:strand:- start:718 stop:933 length:216 start_codon:yes stop_codon:yes gene_type:complete
MDIWKTINPIDYNKTIPYYEVNRMGDVRIIDTKKLVIKPENLNRYFLMGVRINKQFLIDKYFNDTQYVLRI